MRRFATTFVVCLFLPACSSGGGGGEPNDAAVPDATQDVAAEGAAHEGGGAETGGGEAGGDASEAGCAASWFVAPGVDPSIAVPEDGGTVLIHATGNGSQNYACTA